MTNELKKQSKQIEIETKSTNIVATNEINEDLVDINTIANRLGLTHQGVRQQLELLNLQPKTYTMKGERKNVKTVLYSWKEIRQQQQQKQFDSFKKIVLKATKEDVKTLFYALLVKLQMEKREKIEGETNKIKEFVYVFKDDKYYKIGKTNNIQNRLNAFKTANIDIEAVMTIQVENAIQFETCLHNYFHDKWVDGEWFDLSEEDLQELVLMGFNYGIGR